MKVFVVEDDSWYNKLLVHTLSLNPDLEVEGFHDASSFFKAMTKSPANVVTLDYRLPDKSGIEILEQLNQSFPDTQVIVISEQEDIEVVVDLLKKGAYDYMVKSNDIKNKLLNTIAHIGEQGALKKQISDLQKEVGKKYAFKDFIKGNSPAMKAVFELMEKALKTNINVSIFGETGTGKEVVAKAIHYNSNRKTKNLVSVNVSAIPKDLIESELFGHEKGAFTGANSRRIGKFEEANQGTLFLDEIGEMEPEMQSKLLRVLQEKELNRVGGNERIKIDCRIIIATHKSLEELVEKGEFREDLYYRLQGLKIQLPPLKNRGNDILVLAQHFLKSFCKENDLGNKSFDEAAIKKLLSYAFPGNVRELKSVVELAATLANEDSISDTDIQFQASISNKNSTPTNLTLEEHNQRILDMYLETYDHNISKIARTLDIGKATIYRMMKRKEE